MKLNIQTIISESSFCFIILIGLVDQVVLFALRPGRSTAHRGDGARLPFTFVSIGGYGGVGVCRRSFVPLSIFFSTTIINKAAALVTHCRSRTLISSPI